MLLFFSLASCQNKKEEVKKVKSEELIIKSSPLSDEISHRAIREYNITGNVTKVFYVTKDKNKKELDLKYEYQYNLDNKASKIITYNNSKVAYEQTYNYKDSKLILEQLFLYPNGKPDLNSYTNLEYIDNKIIEKTYLIDSISKNYNLSTIKTKLLDEFKNLRELQISNPKGEITYKKEYQYDNKNLLIKETSSIGAVTEYSYDHNDNIIKELINTGNYINVTEYVYKYDKYNNWIERIQRNFYNFKENKKIDSEEISIKKLEYFD